MAEGMYCQRLTRLLLTNDRPMVPDTGKLGTHFTRNAVFKAQPAKAADFSSSEEVFIANQFTESLMSITDKNARIDFLMLRRLLFLLLPETRNLGHFSRLRIICRPVSRQREGQGALRSQWETARQSAPANRKQPCEAAQHESARFRNGRKQVGVRIGAYARVGHDLPAVVDTGRFQKFDSQRGINERVKVHHLAVAIKKGTREAGGVLRNSHDLTDVVQGESVAVAGYVVYRSEVLHLAVAVEKRVTS